MRTVGKFKPDEKSGDYSGAIRTLAIDLPRVRICLVEKRTPESPDFAVCAVLSGGEMVEIGAGWKRTSQAGMRYVSMLLDDPSMPAPLNLAMMPPGEGDGDTWRALWSRPSSQERAAA
jgi:uncharacterized protein (DUF736 family)